MTLQEKKRLSMLDSQERVSLVYQMRIFYPRQILGINMIRRVQGLFGVSDEPQCVFICGEAGSGKSTIFKEYQSRYYQEIPQGEVTKIPVVAVEIESPVTKTTFLDQLLGALGDPYFSRDTFEHKRIRLKHLLNACGVEIILLDEFQHMLNSKNKKVLQDVADMFKSLVNHTEIPVALFGQDMALTVLKENRQLGRRAAEHYNLESFSLETDQEKEEFMAVLKTIDEMLPFAELSMLDDFGTVKRMYDATGGLIDKVMKLVRRGAEFAIYANHTSIQPEDFAKAFEVYREYLRVPNPFLQE